MTDAEALSWRLASFDLETHLIQDGLLAPPAVCGSYAELTNEGIHAEILTLAQARERFIELLTTDRIIVGANIAYDMMVMAADFARRGFDLMPLIFAKYDRGEVFDIQIAEALHAIAGGHLGTAPSGRPLYTGEGKVTNRYSLATCVFLVLGRDNAKVNDEWRLRYHELENVPMDQWPFTARQYPIDDARNTLEVALAQLGAVARPEGAPDGAGLWPSENIHQVLFQTSIHWALHLGACWGFNVDPDSVQDLADRVAQTRSKNLQTFIDAKFFKMKPCPECVTGGNAPSDYNSNPMAGCGTCYGAEEIPQTSEKTGAEKKRQAYIKMLAAVSYGCDVPCDRCTGTGRVPGRTKCKPCNGTGQGAETTFDCDFCNGEGKVDHKRNTRGCPNCDGTGVDLDSAPAPRTDGGGISIGRDALAESGEELLMQFAAFSEEDKLRTTYIPFLRRGIGKPLNPRPNVLVATGRTSSGQEHQLPRSGGVRECIKSRKGYTFISCDYGQLELYTHAQSCIWLLGFSKLAEALNAGVEVHVKLAAAMAGITYEEGLALHLAKDPWFKPFRQAAKPGNYGFPGGMGAVKLVLQQRKQGPDTVCDGAPGWITVKGKRVRGYKGLRFCVLVKGKKSCGSHKITTHKGREYTPVCADCVDVAESLRDEWFKAWPENKPYFKLISQLVETQGWITQHVSKRRRGGLQFTNAANTFFQGLAADGAKLALYRVTRECYAVPTSPLYGTRPILFAHDEIIAEAPLARASAAAKRIGEIMVEAMREYLPDTGKNLEAEPCLMDRWYKGAEPVFDDTGELVPWEPKKKAA